MLESEQNAFANFSFLPVPPTNHPCCWSGTPEMIKQQFGGAQHPGLGRPLGAPRLWEGAGGGSLPERHGHMINMPRSKRQKPCAQMLWCYEIIFGPQWGEKADFSQSLAMASLPCQSWERAPI